MHATELLAQLAQFTGSETLTRHALVRSMLMTEGVAFLAEQAGAYWLATAIASYLHDDRARREEFQVWRLIVEPTTCSAMLTMTDGNGISAIITQEIAYTDFPLAEVALWLVASGNHWVLMLPSEY